MPPLSQTFAKLDFVEEGRQDIYKWSERRQKKFQHRYKKSLYLIRIFAFDFNLLKSFLKSFNIMVVLQMILAGLITYACKSWDIVYDVHVTLFVSPIVFPLAFSINTDFQRREKVLEDLANFKSSSMMWFFCLRDWREACQLDHQYMKAVNTKIRGLLFHLREYLITEKIDRRNHILRVIYEDLSDANQLNEKVRTSNMPANSPLVSRMIHLLNMMCLSFERLRVVREYRSPRSIRSFTKVLIFALPLLLSPYYVFLGSHEFKINGRTLRSDWSPYYISVMVAFVFGALQSVQDKLDDPFDGMSEDDINLNTLDEWTGQSLEATAHRTYKVGRFQVSSNPDKAKNTVINAEDQVDNPKALRRNYFPRQMSQQPNIKRQQSVYRSPVKSPRSIYSDDEPSDEFDLHPYAGVLNNIKGNTTILRGGYVKPNKKSYDDLLILNDPSLNRGKTYSFNHVVFGGDNSSQIDFKDRVSSPDHATEKDGIFTLFHINRGSSSAMEQDSLETSKISPVVESMEECENTGIQGYLANLNKIKNNSQSLNRKSLASLSSISRETDDTAKSFYISESHKGNHTADKLSYERVEANNSTEPLLEMTNSHLETSESSQSSDEEKKLLNSANKGRFRIANKSTPDMSQQNANDRFQIRRIDTDVAIAARERLHNVDHLSLHTELKDEEIFI